MENRFESCTLCPVTEEYAAVLKQWTYPEPYSEYSFRGDSDGWLMNRATWGTEQFCLADGEGVVAHVACQTEGSDLWVGWSLEPSLCGRGNGHLFVCTCLRHLLAVNPRCKRVLLRVAARNQRAIRAYMKAGFVYLQTIQDEIAYTNRTEDFWVMEYLSSAGKQTV